MRLILLFVLVTITNFQVFSQYTDPTQTDAVVKSEMTHAMHRANYKSRVAGLSDSIDVVYHELNWTVFPGDSKIKGNVYTEFSVTNGSINNLYFDMHDSLIVDSVWYHGAVVSSIRNNDNTVVISLPSALNTGIHDSIRIYYHGNPTDAFFTRAHSNVSEVYTLSEPYGAPNWWPCKDGLNDKIDSVDINITTSIGNMAGSLGLLESVDTIGNEVTYHWKHRFPVSSYLISLAVTNYVEFTEYVHVGVDSFPVLNYVYPEHLFYAKSQVPRIVAMFDLYDSLFIPYPFRAEKYGHAETQLGGGMEHQTMSTMGSFGDDLMAHELAHQWFGDYVTCASWQELWLNEGFATFLTGLTHQFSADLVSWESWKRGKIRNVTSSPDGSVFVSDTTRFGRLFSSRLTYDKGSLLLHMLRWKLSDSLFFSGVTNYLNDPKVKLGYGTNQDLISHLEATSNQDLTEFFADWFYGEGYPTYTVTLAGSQPNYSVRISQTTSHASVDFFEMPVEIQFQGTGLDTHMVFDNTVNDQWFDFTLDSKIAILTLDPNSWLLMGTPQIILGANEVIKAKNTPILYPQPATDYVRIMNVNSNTNPAQGKLYDVAGNQLNVNFRTSGTDWVLDIENLPAGMYFIVHSDWDKPLKFVK